MVDTLYDRISVSLSATRFRGSSIERQTVFRAVPINQTGDGIAHQVDRSEWFVPGWAAWLATLGLGIAIIGIIGRLATGEQNYALAASIGFAVIFAALCFAKKRKT